MMAASGMPTKHPARGFARRVVFTKHPPLALTRSFSKSLHAPARRLTQDCLNFGGGLAVKKLRIGKNVIHRVQVFPNRNQRCTLWGNSRLAGLGHGLGDVYYSLYRGGKLADEYSSRPDYFEPLTNQAQARWKGKPDRLAALLLQSLDQSQLQDLLAQGRDQPLFASESLQQSARLLSIPNALAAYE